MFKIDIHDLPDSPLLVKNENNKYYLVSYGRPLMDYDNGMEVYYSHPEGFLEITFFAPEINEVPVTIKNWSLDLPNFVTTVRDFPDELPCKMSCINLEEVGGIDVRDIEGHPVDIEPFCDEEEMH